MGFLIILAALWLALLSGCAPSVSGPQETPSETVREQPAPFAGKEKTEIPKSAKAHAHFIQGQLYLTEGNLSGAVKEYELAIRADPSNAFLRLRLATLYLRQGQLDGALKEAEEASRLEPEELQSHQLLAGLYSSTGQDARGIEEYEKVLQLNPKNQEALLYLGALHLKGRDFEQAVKYLE